MLKEILILVLLLIAVPVGYIISYLCRDELIIGRKWFKIILFTCFIGFFAFLFYNQESISISLAFIFIVTLISLKRSYNKKLTSKKLD